MQWIAELVIQPIWEAACHFAQHRWGWRGVAVVLITPFAVGGLVILYFVAI